MEESVIKSQRDLMEYSEEKLEVLVKYFGIARDQTKEEKTFAIAKKIMKPQRVISTDFNFAHDTETGEWTKTSTEPSELEYLIKESIKPIITNRIKKFNKAQFKKYREMKSAGYQGSFASSDDGELRSPRNGPARDGRKQSSPMEMKHDKNWPIIIVITGGEALEYYFTSEIFKTDDIDIKFMYSPSPTQSGLRKVKRGWTTETPKQHSTEELERLIKSRDEFLRGLVEELNDKSQKKLYAFENVDFSLSGQFDVPIKLPKEVEEMSEYNRKNWMRYNYRRKMINMGILDNQLKYKYVNNLSISSYMEYGEGYYEGHVLDSVILTPNAGVGKLEVYKKLPKDIDEVYNNLHVPDDKEIRVLDNYMSYGMFMVNISPKGLLYAPLGYVVWDTIKMINRGLRTMRLEPKKESEYRKLERYIKKYLSILDGLSRPEVLMKCNGMMGFVNMCINK